MKFDSLILSDGTRGMENQSIAISKYLDLNYKVLKIKPNFFIKNFPKLALLFYLFFKKQILFLKKFKFLYLITTGRRMSGYSILAKKVLKNNFYNIHLQDPKIHPSLFDILLVPEHDQLVAKNVFKTQGALTFFTQKDIDFSYKLIKEKLNPFKRPLVFLLLGGDNKRYKPNYSEYCRFLLNVKKAVENISGSLVISTSRRTPDKVLKIIKLIFDSFDKNFYLINDKEKKFYPGILKKTDYVIVTSDSVNMISEVATTDSMLFVGYIREENKKILKFNNFFERKSYTRKFKGHLYNYNKIKLNDRHELKKQVTSYIKEILYK